MKPAEVEIAHAAIDAGADEVMGHGPHYARAVSIATKPTSCDPSQDREAVDQIMRRCDKLGTTLTISGSEMTVGTKL